MTVSAAEGRDLLDAALGLKPLHELAAECVVARAIANAVRYEFEVYRLFPELRKVEEPE